MNAPIRLIAALGVCLGCLLCAGCIGHGDAIGFYRIRGTLVDSAGNQPLGGASVWVTPRADHANDRARMIPATTTTDGSFAAQAGRRIGSVTWFVVPVHSHRENLPSVETIYIDVEQGERVGRAAVHPAAAQQCCVSGGHREIDLGTIVVQMHAKGLR